MKKLILIALMMFTCGVVAPCQSIEPVDYTEVTMIRFFNGAAQDTVTVRIEESVSPWETRMGRAAHLAAIKTDLEFAKDEFELTEDYLNFFKEIEASLDRINSLKRHWVSGDPEDNG